MKLKNSLVGFLKLSDSTGDKTYSDTFGKVKF